MIKSNSVKHRRLQPKILLAKKIRLIFLAMIVLPAAFFLIKSIKQSFFSSKNSFSWVLAEAGGKMLLVSHQANSSAGFLVFIDPDLVFNSAKNLGNYPVRNLFTLGEQQEVGGGKLIKQTIQESLFVPVDRYLYVKEVGMDFTKLGGTAGRTIKKALWLSLLGRAKTDLTYFDRFKLLWFFINSRSSVWKSTRLLDYSGVKTDSFAGETGSGNTQFDDLFLSEFADHEILASEISIAVANAGNCAGAGNKTVALLRHLGAYAFIINNEFDHSQKTSMQITDGKLRQTNFFIRIVDIFNIDEVKLVDKPMRADMVIVLGDNYCLLTD